jgi:hypothetical protein
MCLWRRGVVTRETYRHVVREGLAIARAQSVPTPTLDTLAAIGVRRARDRGLL